MRLHLVSLPHTQTTDDYSWCAFTSLVKTFSTMMTEFGYEVILYSGPDNEAKCTEHVECSVRPPSTDPVVPGFTRQEFEPMNLRVIAEMQKRIQPEDIICLTSGWSQALISDAFPNHLQVEPIAGYAGTYARHRVFPSYAWMHILYSKWGHANPQAIRGVLTDKVIPHFLDPDQFPMGSGSEDYLLFCARLNEDKGINIAVDVAKQMGMPLKIIGAGTPPEYGEYLGVVGPKERAQLMGDAVAVLSPSLYCEPFCLVAVEAQMCGTPAITTDFGAFPETVLNGITGFRCATVDEFCTAVDSSVWLDRGHIRQLAITRFASTNIAPSYAMYFEQLKSSIFG